MAESLEERDKTELWNDWLYGPPHHTPCKVDWLERKYKAVFRQLDSIKIVGFNRLESKVQPGVAAQAITASTQADLCDFEASLVYIVSSSLAKAI